MSIRSRLTKVEELLGILESNLTEIESPREAQPGQPRPRPDLRRDVIDLRPFRVHLLADENSQRDLEGGLLHGAPTALDGSRYPLTNVDELTWTAPGYGLRGWRIWGIVVYVNGDQVLRPGPMAGPVDLGPGNVFTIPPGMLSLTWRETE